MRKFLIASTLIISAAAFAAPASAQYYPDNRYGYRGGGGIDRQLQHIEDRIRRAADRGRITRREEYRLLRLAERIDRLEDRYSRNGLTQWEYRDLQNRVHHLRQQLRFERHDGRWDDRRDRWDDRRGDRWDDRRDDDDRWDD